MHLTDAEFVEHVEGILRPDRVAHLESCEACRRQAEGLRRSPMRERLTSPNRRRCSGIASVRRFARRLTKSSRRVPSTFSTHFAVRVSRWPPPRPRVAGGCSRLVPQSAPGPRLGRHNAGPDLGAGSGSRLAPGGSRVDLRRHDGGWHRLGGGRCRGPGSRARQRRARG